MKYKHIVHNYMLDPSHPLTVAVIGCGGTGSQVLTSLGRMNYALKKMGHPGFSVTAYDGDIVTEANCGRQLFAQQEIGLNKADVLITKLNMFFGTDWESESKMYGNGSEAYNITISCVDTVQSRIDIGNRLGVVGRNVYDYNRSYYWLDFGNSVNSGQVVLGSLFEIQQPKGKRSCVGKLPCVTEMFDLSSVDEKASGPSCSLAEALTKQDLFVNSTLAQLGMAIFWKLFSKGAIDVHGAYLNLETMNVNPIKVMKHGKV